MAPFRDIYYRQPDLFVKQAIVDRYVYDIACTFGVSRCLLNVTAAAKGLVTGPFILTRHDGSKSSALAEQGGMLVPELNKGNKLDLTAVEFVLVIEKEATFRSLLTSDLRNHGILLTAKGYPDIATRSFLRAIADTRILTGNTIPLYALVDYDPDGIGILSTYKYGSLSLAHENATLIVPSIQWLGVASSFLSNVDAVQVDQGLLQLSKRDRHLALRMLQKNVFTENGPEPKWRRELQIMLMLGVKAEIQILEGREGGLHAWLKERLHFAV